MSHTLTALRAALREVGVDADEQAPLMLQATTSDVPGLVSAVRSRLSSAEAAEVRAVQLEAEQGHALVAPALGAATLAQLGARAGDCALSSDVVANSQERWSTLLVPPAILASELSPAAVIRMR